ncbi:basic salivary proline-rich protein 2-like [Centroberyx affinis]|uniref:basic salivary proline-rich protein 2-like n=1 Tax=Centroberyx affinis TaxID=166261 RepID=UPI003A5C44EA
MGDQERSPRTALRFLWFRMADRARWHRTVLPEGPPSQARRSVSPRSKRTARAEAPALLGHPGPFGAFTPANTPPLAALTHPVPATVPTGSLGNHSASWNGTYPPMEPGGPAGNFGCAPASASTAREKPLSSASYPTGSGLPFPGPWPPGKGCRLQAHFHPFPAPASASTTGERPLSLASYPPGKVLHKHAVRVRRGATIIRPRPSPVTNGSTHRPKPAIRGQPKIRGTTVYRPSQTPHLPLSLERVTPGRAGRLTPEARARSGLASPPHRSAARRQPRRPTGTPHERTLRERGPAGGIAGEIREKGPARVQSRRRRPPYPIPSTSPPSDTAADTAPRKPPQKTPATRRTKRRGREPRKVGRTPRFQRRREEGDGATAPPAAARAQPRFAPQPDRPSP